MAARLEKLEGRNRCSWGALIIGGTLAFFAIVAFVDAITGVEISFSIFYLIPVLFAAYYMGDKGGIGASVMGAILWHISDVHVGGHVYSAPGIPYWNAVVRLGFFLVSSVLLVRLRSSIERLRANARKLADAYQNLDRATAQQLLVKDQLLSHVSHELRTPLTALHQFTSLVTDGIAGELNPLQKEYLDVVMRNAQQLNRMIDDLLDTTSVDAGKFHLKIDTVSANDMITGVVETMRSAAANKDITVSYSIEEGVPPISCDQARIRQVLLNLVDNAVKFTPRGGSIEIASRRCRETAEFLEVAVSDTGPGISQDAQRRLFQRLYQEEQEEPVGSRRGLGLGLYLSREILSMHGGRIWTESVPGRGSRFYFTVPFSREETAAPATKEISDT